MAYIAISTADRHINPLAGGHPAPYLGLRTIGARMDVGTAPADYATGEYYQFIWTGIKHCIISEDYHRHQLSIHAS